MHHKDNEGIDRKLKTKKNNWSERLFVCTIQITDERCLYYSAEHDPLGSGRLCYGLSIHLHCEHIVCLLGLSALSARAMPEQKNYLAIANLYYFLTKYHKTSLTQMRPCGCWELVNTTQFYPECKCSN